MIDSILAGESSSELTPRPLHGLRFAIPQTLVLDDLESPVSSAFARALAAISRSGGILVEIKFAELAELRTINAKGGFSAAEAYTWHRSMIAANADQYDPQILKRILRGREQSAADYIDLFAARGAFVDRARRFLADFDAALMPTVPIVAPRIADVAADEAFTSTNLELLRNPSIANFLNACAISVPCHRNDEPPVGITVQGISGDDRNILAIAASIETIVSPRRV